MTVVAMQSWKKSWQTGRERVSVEAALAIQRENVVNRLVRLREEIGHPEKEGEPLPQDQAAAKAGVTVRQWQRWENGVSVPYARNLSAVADAFGFDVAEFYDGPAGQAPAVTPDPFPPAVEPALTEILAAITAQLAEQTKVLERIEQSVARDQRTKAELDESAERLLAAAAAASRALSAGTPDPAVVPERQAK